MAEHSLQTGKFCCNCLNRLELLDLSPSGVRCKCSNCQSQKFSLCGGCHIASYCSRECQREHWMYNHKRMCKVFSGEELSKEACLAMALKAVAARKKKDPQLHLLQLKSEELLVSCFWNIFRSDRGTTDCQTREYPDPLSAVKLPFIVGQGNKNGWIDQYLDYLHFLVLKNLVEDQESPELHNLNHRVLRLRATYFFHLSLERDRKLTELKFAVLALRQLSFDLYSCCDNYNPFENYDKKIKASGSPNVLWEALLFNLAKFCKRLRMIKYKFINIESLKKKRPADYQALEPFYRNGQRLLKNVEVRLDKDGGYDSRRSRAILPPNTLCVGCNLDLGGFSAQLLLGSSCPLENFQVVRVADTPCVLEMMNTQRPIVTCGKDAKCSTIAKQLYLEFLAGEMSPLMKILPDCRICASCSRYSLKTHKCSRCRKARYCSQDCLNEDWKYHQLRCEEVTEQSSQELSVSKKLEGEARQEYVRECFIKIIYYDPMMIIRST